jgi:type IV secretion system protein TrbL
MRRSSATGLVALVAVLLLLTEPAFAADMIDSTITQYQTAAGSFGDKVRSIGVRLLFLLFGIQLAINGIKYVLKSQDVGEILGGVVYSVFSVGFFFALIEPLHRWLPTVIDSFTKIGQTGSGLAELSPSGIISQASDIISVMLTKYNASEGMLSILKNFFPSLILAFAAIVIFAAFCVLAWQMALAMISGYFWLAFMPVLLGFGGISFTRDIAMNALKGGIAIGMKIAVVYLVAGTAGTLAPIWGEQLNTMTVTNLEPLWQIVFGAGLLAYLSFQLPKLAADLMNGTASLSAGDAASNMLMGAAGMAAVGGGAAAVGKAGAGLGASATTGALSGAAGLAQAAQAGLASAADKGKTGLSAAAHAASEVVNHGLGLGGTAVSRTAASASASFSDQVAGSAGAKIARSIDATRGGSIGPGGSGTAATGAPTAAHSQATASAAPGGGALQAEKGFLESIGAQPPGDAAGASIAGGRPASTAGGLGSASLARPLHERIRDIGNQVPQDQHTVGLSANISSHVPE